MKRIAMLLLFCTLLLIGCSEQQTEGLVFTQQDGSYAITGYTGSNVKVVVPDTYNNKPVTVIAENAFANSDIQSVVMGKNIVKIAENAFSNATLLKSVELNSNIEVIGSDKLSLYGNITGAFAGCVSLETVNIPSNCNLTILGRYTFYGCGKLENIELPNQLKNIGQSAFANCVSLDRIEIPASVDYVEDTAFAGFTEDQEITLVGSSNGWSARWKTGCSAKILQK